MAICPNLSNPQVAKEFNELKQAIGEKAAYHVWSLNNGNNIDMAPNGEPSILFQVLLENADGNRIEAIRLKANTLTPKFVERFKNTDADVNGEPTNYSQIINLGTISHKPVNNYERYEITRRLKNYIYSRIYTISSKTEGKRDLSELFLYSDVHVSRQTENNNNFQYVRISLVNKEKSDKFNELKEELLSANSTNDLGGTVTAKEDLATGDILVSSTEYLSFDNVEDVWQNKIIPIDHRGDSGWYDKTRKESDELLREQENRDDDYLNNLDRLGKELQELCKR